MTHISSKPKKFTWRVTLFGQSLEAKRIKPCTAAVGRERLPDALVLYSLLGRTSSPVEQSEHKCDTERQGHDGPSQRGLSLWRPVERELPVAALSCSSTFRSVVSLSSFPLGPFLSFTIHSSRAFSFLCLSPAVCLRYLSFISLTLPFSFSSLFSSLF